MRDEEPEADQEVQNIQMNKKENLRKLLGNIITIVMNTAPFNNNYIKRMPAK